MNRLFFLASLLISPLLLSAQSQSCPCCTENHRSFDFWIGEWEVYDQAGQTLLGTSVISLVEGGCVIQEEWTSATPGYTGRSLNLYERNSGTWRQYWIDVQGNLLQLEGGMEGSSMVMGNVVPARDTIPESINRISWTPQEDGRVRQTWKTSSDSGENWTTLFDGFYTKKESDD